VIELDIQIIEKTAEFDIINVGHDVYREIKHYNVTFIIHFDNRGLIKDIEPITIKIKEMPDSSKKLKKIIFDEFAKMFQPRVIK
jgi:hypothetical protein